MCVAGWGRKNGERKEERRERRETEEEEQEDGAPCQLTFSFPQASGGINGGRKQPDYLGERRRHVGHPHITHQHTHISVPAHTTIVITNTLRKSSVQIPEPREVVRWALGTPMKTPGQVGLLVLQYLRQAVWDLPGTRSGESRRTRQGGSLGLVRKWCSAGIRRPHKDMGL